MLTSLSAIILGFAVLIWSADRFIYGAAALSRNLGISPLIIGLTIVGFGTSAPEMLVSAFAAAQGNPGLAIGNAVGSNIANIALILGVTALVTPLVVGSRILRREMPVLLLVMVFAGLLLLNGHLERLDGALLLLGLVIVLAWIVYDGLRSRTDVSDPMGAEFDAEIPNEVPTTRALIWLALGLVLLLISARILVWGAVNVAEALGVSDLIIGLTIIAIGTSLPELAASVVSARRGEPDIAIGNVIGSNMFNLLGVLALPGLIHPAAVPGDVLTRDFPVMLGLTLLFLVMAFGLRGRAGRIGRPGGLLLVACFVGYLVWLGYSM
ncbi:CaCA family Na(+)/Ca(+) antiporter [Thioalkalivibrio sulfidiphilus HL-EbGr7]|uniref:CaCA family Na(+)/Ca(+) antiporter n=1 Tax=Thioalkalivibrio sulfidiphilus (strain HL-EbGR7) TaxID=396588 RepID=B8GMJ2_THISH|nr:calcium/sodium antiporter [Thioalkalivibrio sulfidiphilus]ACL71824.1 CaCA family Na(+)/Ca(+) antiporter [Thioalkalivibrio sulfidiphilus HL-EbGr7]